MKPKLLHLRVRKEKKVGNRCHIQSSAAVMKHLKYVPEISYRVDKTVFLNFYN